VLVWVWGVLKGTLMEIESEVRWGIVDTVNNLAKGIFLPKMCPLSSHNIQGSTLLGLEMGVKTVSVLGQLKDMQWDVCLGLLMDALKDRSKAHSKGRLMESKMEDW
jgi:hypothetical protein